ncbi:cytochrome P450 [Viridothelium virens]|uniref:Cytochrome P450 n=1 Tax=Viridothelium virens TaxID=1048519 RepID=A0A6A6H9B4_VIRVR|nr:cytochrome P450 [Viridothelium virens]
MEDPHPNSIVLRGIFFIKAYFVYVVLGLIVVRGLYRRYASPLRHIPGPFIASCTRGWKFWHVYRGHVETNFIELHRKFGPVVRSAPNEVSFASTAAAKDIFTSGKGFRKSDFYWVFPPPENPDIFTEVREWKHAQMKRFAVVPYSLSSMQKLTPSIEETERLLLQKIDRFTASPQAECDLGDWLHWFAFDVLGEVAFSCSFGFLEKGMDVEGAIKLIDDMQWYDGLIGQVPWLHYILRLNPLKPYVPFMGVSKPSLITRLAREELRKREQEGADLEVNQQDLMGQLLKAHAGSPDKFSKADVFSVAHGAIFAGSDSTASTMQSFFHLLLSHPSVYTRVVAEINEAQNAGKLSPMVQYQEAQDLPYFQACLKEAMRIRPAVGLNIERVTPPQGTEIGGANYPGGTTCAVNGWVLHRDKARFGQDADVYRPERWLEDNAKDMERYLFQFGGGSHLCIGRNLALLEINKLLPQLLREYHFKLVHPDRPLQYHSTFFVVQSGLKVFVERRSDPKA